MYEEEELIPHEVIPNILLPKQALTWNYEQYSVNVSYSGSPSLFFVQLKCEAEYFNMFLENFSAHYSSVNVNEPMKVASLPIGSTWAVLSRQVWYRATVLKQLNLAAKPSFSMLCVDFGFTRTVHINNIFYLEKEFTMDAPFALQCRLTETYPLSKWEIDPWKDDAKEFMRKFCCDSEELRAIFFKSKMEDGFFEVILESSDGKILNEELVKEGLALSTLIRNFQEWDKTKDERDEGGDLTALPSNKEEKVEEVSHKWDPMSSEFFESVNTNYVDRECAELVFHGFRNQDDEVICKYFRNNKKCPHGELCEWKHILPREDGLPSVTEETFFRLEDDVILPPEGAIFYCIITAAYSPSEFYIHIIPLIESDKGQEEYQDLFTPLQEELCDFYKHSRGCMNPYLPAPGELMVVNMDDDDNNNNHLKGYHRVRVLRIEWVDQLTLIKVFFIDIGFEKWVKEHQLRQFSTQFLRPPCQAVRCYLSDVSPSGDGKWSEEAMKIFAEFVENKVNVALVTEVDDIMDDRLGLVILEESDGEVDVLNEALVEEDVALSSTCGQFKEVKMSMPKVLQCKAV